jgi:hypothetical protein
MTNTSNIRVGAPNHAFAGAPHLNLVFCVARLEAYGPCLVTRAFWSQHFQTHTEHLHHHCVAVCWSKDH